MKPCKIWSFSDGEIILTNSLPRHIAIIMDGNGRWAKERNLSRIAGHKAGLDAAREIIQSTADLGDIEVLSLFAFSSENWKRPKVEINALMELFIKVLQTEIHNLQVRNIQLRFIGNRLQFSNKLQDLMLESEERTKDNTGLTLIIAANYGGHWDIVEAARKLAADVQSGDLMIDDITQEVFANTLSLSEYPSPDLFIRTSGEQRLSNFFLWQLAYTELYFTPVYWPDFKTAALHEALNFFANRQRRFGCTAEQLESAC